MAQLSGEAFSALKRGNRQSIHSIPTDHSIYPQIYCI